MRFKWNFLLLILFVSTVSSNIKAEEILEVSIFPISKDTPIDKPYAVYSYSLSNGVISKFEKKVLRRNGYEKEYSYEVFHNGNNFQVIDKEKNKELNLVKNNTSYTVTTITGKRKYISIKNNQIYLDGNIDENKRDESIEKTQDGIRFLYFLNKPYESNNVFQDISVSFNEYGSVLSFLRSDRMYKKYTDQKSKLVKDKNKNYYEYVYIDNQGETTDICYLINYEIYGNASPCSLVNYFLIRYIDIPDPNVIKMLCSSISANSSLLEIF